MSEAKSKGAAGQTSWAVPKSSKALFCADCGSILDLPDSFNIVKCPDCTYTIQAASTQGAEHVQTKIMPDADEVKTQTVDPTMRRAVVAEQCPNCEYHELRFYTMQMRSVDEGQTVFYECEKCGHTYSTNT